MIWALNSDRPIYAQLVDIIQMQIFSGEYLAGSKLPSVREFASMAQVNPNTMQKALSELEQTGLVVSLRTSGRFVTDDMNVIALHKKELALQQIQSFLSNMQRFGYEHHEIISLLKESEVNTL